MSKKRDPIVDVLRYFEDAELPLAQQALVLAKEIVRHRAPRTTVPARVRPRPAKRPGGINPAAEAVS